MALTVSIITASFNSAATIVRCLESVSAQKYKDIEHVIVDGASCDDTARLISENAIGKTKFICETDGGLYEAWNKGFRLSGGDYVLILNSDDELHDADVVVEMIEFIEERGRPAIVYGRLKACEMETGYSYLDGRPATLKSLLYRMDMCTLATFIRKDVFERVGQFDESYKIASDYDWAIRLFKTISEKEIVFHDRIVVNFSLSGISNKRYREAYSEVDRIIRKHYSTIEYLQHRAYVGGRMLLKAALPCARAVGILAAWRRFRTALAS